MTQISGMLRRLFRMADANEFVYRPFPDAATDLPATPGPRDAILAGGCFWCTEAVYRQIDGVLGVESGYSGGAADTANYEAVCSGRTGHAEAIRITYDPARLTYGTLLKVFFATAHDPTQLNRQGNDIGTQYRSAIFWASEAERDVAAAYIAQLDAAKVFPAKIATTLEKLDTFYPAETYHQDYAARNPGQGYIRAVSAPKVEKTRKVFAHLLKTAPAK
jgi:peptide-methionine (S)-S-oxide reductase